MEIMRRPPRCSGLAAPPSIAGSGDTISRVIPEQSLDCKARRENRCRVTCPNGMHLAFRVSGRRGRRFVTTPATTLRRATRDKEYHGHWPFDDAAAQAEQRFRDNHG